MEPGMPDDLPFPDSRCLLHIGSYVYTLTLPARLDRT